MNKEMNKKMKISVHRMALLLTVFCFGVLNSSPNAQAGDHRTLEFWQFRLGGIYATNTSGETYSGQLTWNPELHLGKLFSLIGNLGASYFKSNLDTKFTVVDYGGILGINLGKLTLEGQAGIQSWTNRKSYTLVGGGLTYRFVGRKLGLFDRIFVGYNTLLDSGDTKEIKAGIGFSF